jgi:hypothetical protein
MPVRNAGADVNGSGNGLGARGGKGKNGIQARLAARPRTPRSAVTSGRQLFIAGDPNSAWARRYADLFVGHINDLGGPDTLSDAQFSLIRRATAIECELERLDALLSVGTPVDMDSYARVSGHLRRLFETIGLKRQARVVGELTLAEFVGDYSGTPYGDDAQEATPVATEAIP